MDEVKEPEYGYQTREIQNPKLLRGSKKIDGPVVILKGTWGFVQFSI